MTSGVIDGYEAAAADLIPRFEQISPETLLAPIARFLPIAPAHILDIGAGTGRVAEWLAGQGHHVVAIEPVAAFRAIGMARLGDISVDWVDDRLPELAHLADHALCFDTVILSAVWHHLNPSERAAALPILRNCLGPAGRLILSLRDGPGVARRPDFLTTADEVTNMALDAGFRLLHRARVASVQERNAAAGVRWDWMVFDAA